VSAVKAKPRLLTAKDCSLYVDGVKSERWFKDQARAGKIRYSKFGRTIVIAEPDLEEFVAAHLCDAYGRRRAA